MGPSKAWTRPLFDLPSGSFVSSKTTLPALRGLLEDLGVVHEHVRAPLVGHAVVLAVHGVPGGVLQAGIHLAPARHEGDVDLLHPAPADQPEAGVAGGGHEVEAALVHEGHHLVGGRGGLHADLAARLLLEARDPVVALVRLPALDVAGPGHDRHRALAGSQLLQRASGGGRGRRGLRARGETERSEGERKRSWLHSDPSGQERAEHSTAHFISRAISSNTSSMRSTSFWVWRTDTVHCSS